VNAVRGFGENVLYSALFGLALAACLNAEGFEDRLTVSGEFQAPMYPQQSVWRDARQADFRGWLQTEYKGALGRGLSFRGDLTAYGMDRSRVFLDGTAALV
jgi:hypothetical protein